MKKTAKKLSVALSALMLTGAALPLGGCEDGEEATFFPTVVIAQADGDAYTPTIDGEPNKIEIPLLSGDIYTVCSNYTRAITDGYNTERKDCFAPTPIVISWESEETPLYYTLDLATNSDMENAESYVTFDKEVTFKYLFMGYDYYYRISAKYEDKLIKSRIFKFSTAYLPRTVHIDDNVSNTRDWGGYLAADGMRMKQGIVYRGGELESITEDGKKVMLNDLGIKTDLDVRGDGSSNAHASPLGTSVNYIETTGPYYVGHYGMGIDMIGDYQAALLTEIKAFANPDNFPIYVHCSLGRDRTGTLCFLIQALLGVSEYDIYRDYETSMMSKKGKSDTQTAAYMVNQPFTALYNYILHFKKGKTMQENAEAFMLSIGVTQDEIKSIKKNMLEKV